MPSIRKRSGSMVSNIALTGSVLEQFEQLDPPRESIPFTRSKSVLSKAIECTNKPLDQYMLTPLLEREKLVLWETQFQSNEASIDIDLHDEAVIEDLNSNLNSDYSVLKSNDFSNFLKHIKAENSMFIKDVESIINKLDELLTIHDHVTFQTRDFQSESNLLIEELGQVEKLYTDLTDKFQYFQDLESIAKRLNTVNNSKIVLKSSFHDKILLKLDSCIEFVSNPKYSNYKDITVYRYRFKQCMIRALSLIRNYLITHIRTVETDISKKICDLPTDKDNTIVIDALINNNFTDSMKSVYNLFIEIYNRSYSNDDYFNLLDDVYNQYFKSRGSLITSYIISPHMKKVNFTSDLTELSSTNLNFFMKLVEKEFDIFKKLFFLPPTEITESIDNSANLTASQKFFESVILDPLYYLLRNKILRETRINTLCELINLIRSYTESDKSMYELSQELNLQANGINFMELLRPILEDAQTRLVFRVNKFVESNIVNYKKTGKELIITNKADTKNNGEEESSSTLVENNLIQNPNLIYPPILNAIRLLTQIYQLLNQSVFDDITSSVVHLSLLSLNNNFGDNLTIDCKLYEIRSLILFKEYINTFDIEHARKETILDFSGLKKLYSKFLGKNDKIELKSTEYEGLFNTILGSVPKVINDYVDCRIELQIEIRNVVHEFIKISSKTFIDPLLVSSSDPITAEKMDSINEKLLFNIRNELPRLKSLIKDFIKDTKTSTFLLDGIQEEIQVEYAKFYNTINTTQNGQLLSHLMEYDDVNKVWVKTVKQLFMNDEQNDENIIELKDIQKDLDNLDNDPLDGDSVVASSITSV